MASPQLYMGLMSGTSMDAVDAVLLSIGDGIPGYEIVAHHSSPLPADLRAKLELLCHPGDDRVNLLGETDVALGKLFAETANALLAREGLSPHLIRAIGSHGQTIRHCPPTASAQNPFTIQIGDPNTIAAQTGITTVADFRRKDIALGGEGAPLAPAFHRAVFQSSSINRAVVNIGGIANITWLPASSLGIPMTGFDTGPGNCLMDGWISRHLDRPYDDEGAWANSGEPVSELLETLLGEPYLNQPLPKSTGRELFNMAWLDLKLKQLARTHPPECIQATLCIYTAKTIIDGLRQVAGQQKIEEVFVCGGGAFNSALMQSIQHGIPQATVGSTANQGIHPLQVEGAAFAWLAHQTLNNLPGNVPAVTGAERPAVLGGIFLP